ncbi:unnamed protein product, partial [Gulo gulo]
CAGRAGRPELEALRGRPLPSPSPARAELVFRVPLDRAGSCFCAKAGSEFRTVIPGGVTSEKFFFGGDPSWGWETPV